MSNARSIRREVEELLKNCGRPYSIEAGSKHYHVRVDGNLVGVLCRNPGPRRDSKQIMAAIRQYLARNPK